MHPERSDPRRDCSVSLMNELVRDTVTWTYACGRWLNESRVRTLCLLPSPPASLAPLSEPILNMPVRLRSGRVLRSTPQGAKLSRALVPAKRGRTEVESPPAVASEGGHECRPATAPLPCDPEDTRPAKRAKKEDARMWLTVASEACHKHDSTGIPVAKPSEPHAESATNECPRQQAQRKAPPQVCWSYPDDDDAWTADLTLAPQREWISSSEFNQSYVDHPDHYGSLLAAKSDSAAAFVQDTLSRSDADMSFCIDEGDGLLCDGEETESEAASTASLLPDDLSGAHSSTARLKASKPPRTLQERLPYYRQLRRPSPLTTDTTHEVLAALQQANREYEWSRFFGDELFEPGPGDQNTHLSSSPGATACAARKLIITPINRGDNKDDIEKPRRIAFLRYRLISTDFAERLHKEVQVLMATGLLSDGLGCLPEGSVLPAFVRHTLLLESADPSPESIKRVASWFRVPARFPFSRSEDMPPPTRGTPAETTAKGSIAGLRLGHAGHATGSDARAPESLQEQSPTL
ncbi:hypothetical protein OH77DRAFT_1077904 [Trametes cingulata]|nr:hypothetical protein OH77DRAFT_1077904 [Trametes cingulata]